MRRLHLNTKQWQVMRSHVGACAPEEACGLLVGRGETVHDVWTITNKLHSPTRFRMEPSEQLGAFAAVEDKGLELIGIFHSHPALDQTGARASVAPSETDIAEAAYPVAHVVWSRSSGEWAARAYWIESGVVSDVPIVIDDIQRTGMVGT